MKKFIYACVLILSIILFQLQFDQFNQKLYESYKEYSSSYLESNSEFSAKTISLVTSNNKNSLSVNRLIRDKLLNYAKENKYYLTFMLGENKKNVFHSYNFVYNPIDEFLDDKYLLEDPLSFSDVNQDKYVSSDLNDKEAIHLRYLNQDYYNQLLYFKIEIHNILYENDVFEKQSAIIFFLKYNKENEDIVSYDLNNMFSNDGITLNISERSKLDPSILDYQVVNTDMQYILFFLIIMYMILLILYSIHKAKEVVISTIQGNRFISLYKRTMFPCISISSFIFLGTVIILYMIRVNYYGELGYEFILPLLKLWGIFSIITLLVSIIILYLIRFINPVKILKNSMSFKAIYYFNYACKLLIFVLFAAPMVNQFLELYPLINALKIGYKYEHFYQDYAHISFFDYAKLQMEIDTTSHGPNNNFIKKAYDTYNLLNEKGALYSDYGEVEFTYNYDQPKAYANIYVNKHFYDQFPIYDNDKNEVKYSTKNVTMLVPKKW